MLAYLSKNIISHHFTFLLPINVSNIIKLRTRHTVTRKPLKVLNEKGEDFYPSLDKKIPKRRKDTIMIQYKFYKECMALKNRKSCSFDKSIYYTPLNTRNAEYLTIKFQISNPNSQLAKDIIVLEGKRLVNDAIKVGLSLDSIFFTNEKILESIMLKESANKDVKIWQITENAFKILSRVETPSGILAVFKRPNQDFFLHKSFLPIILIADNIRDPGNLGTIIRSGAASGIEKILLTKGCVDIWNPKVLRSSCGSHFRLQLNKNFEWNDFGSFFKPFDTDIFIANSSEEPNVQSEYYASVDYFKHNRKLCLIIGGETSGVNSEVYKLRNKYNLRQVSIPMQNGVESLNSAIAASILLFEIKRQFLTKINENRALH